jgi:hypothetical protein
MAKIKMKSGEKELRMNHLAIYRLKKNTGKDIREYVGELQNENVEMIVVYDLMFAGMDYETIEEMLEDIEEDKFLDYVTQMGNELGLLLGVGKTDTTQENIEKVK